MTNSKDRDASCAECGRLQRLCERMIYRIAEREQECERLREALEWAMTQIVKPLRRIPGQNDEHCTKYAAALAALEAKP